MRIAYVVGGFLAVGCAGADEGGRRKESAGAEISVRLEASPTELDRPGDVELTAAVTASNGDVTVEFLVDDDPIGSVLQPPYVASVPFGVDDHGSHVARAVATHEDGSVAFSAEVVLEVAIDGACGPDAWMCEHPVCEGSCLAPSHVSGVAGWAAAGDLEPLVVTGGAQFDTSDGSISGLRQPNTDPEAYQVNAGIGFVQQDQGTGPAIAIWVVDGLELQPGPVTFIGREAVVMLSLGDAIVEAGALIDASASGVSPGPGGYRGGVVFADGGGCGGGISSGDESAGGGGFGSNGGDGGHGGTGGLAADCEASHGNLEVLVGGSGGGGGEDSDYIGNPDLFGGGGGGAVQITAFGTLDLSGIVHVGGGGAAPSGGNWRSGSGGGSGGAVFLESPEILVRASGGLYANGGSGASSSNCSAPGRDGGASLDVALGGMCDAAGGDGAAGTTPATSGGLEEDGQPSGGGGGGGLGRIVLNTVTAEVPIVDTVELSPNETQMPFRISNTLDVP